MEPRALLFHLISAAVAGASCLLVACSNAPQNGCGSSKTVTVEAQLACAVLAAGNEGLTDPCLQACNGGSAQPAGTPQIAYVCQVDAAFSRSFASLNADAGGSGDASTSPDSGAPQCPTSPSSVTVTCVPYCA